MAESSITFRHGVDALMKAINLPLSGPEIAGVMLLVGVDALSKITTDYVACARGGTNSYGVRWAPLALQTILNRRFGKMGGKTVTVRQAFSADKAAKDQAKATEKLIKQIAKANEPKMRLFYGKEKAKEMAEAYARKVVGHNTVASRARAYATAVDPGKIGGGIEILRDTGRLLNSLSPKIESSDRVLKVGNATLTVGSNVVYANAQNYGNPKRNLPARQFIPRPEQIPGKWWNDWLELFIAGVGRVMKARASK